MTRLTLLLCMFALCLGCSKPKDPAKTETKKTAVKAPKAPKTPPRDPKLDDAPASWKEVTAIHGDKDLSNEDKLEAVDLFIKAYPDDANITRAKGLHAKLERIVGRDRARERSKTDKVKYVKERQGIAQDMLRGSFVQLLEPLLYMGAQRGAADKHKSKAPFSKVSLTLKTYPAKTYERPIYLGISEFREVSERFLREQLPKKAKELCPSGKKCTHKLLNHLTDARVGKDLIKTPGTLDKGALGLLLEEASLPPDAKVLGVKASDAYQVLRPSVEVYVRVYDAIEQVGLDKAKREYKRALSGRRDMLDFYSGFIQKHKLYEKMGTKREDFWPILSPVGFWMRRIGDGTAPMLVEYAKKQLQTYEPALAEKL